MGKRPDFQRRQYETVAAAIRDAGFAYGYDDTSERYALNLQIDALAQRFRRDNPAFDTSKFRAAAGYDYQLYGRLESKRTEDRAARYTSRFAADARRAAAIRRRNARRANPVPGLTSMVLAGAVAGLARSSRTNAGIRAMRERRAEFATTAEMMLAGIAMLPEARASLDRKLDEYWQEYRFGYYYSGRVVPEVIIGGGLHAAVYAAARAASGNPRPLVIDSSERVGGTFAMSRFPSFYLNSRNRPGLIGLPNKGQALNVIPGAPVQPSALSGLQFQPNTDMAFVIRATLAEFADVLSGVSVTEISAANIAGGTGTVTLSNGESITCKRIIDARGTGVPTQAGLSNGTTVLTFPEFMARMDGASPLRGMRRVAVIGAGDSAKCAVESLIGTGPDGNRSVTALDYVESVDLYGPGLPATCDQWRATQRGRYQDIGGFLPNAVPQNDGSFESRRRLTEYRPRNARVNVYPVRAACTPAVSSVLVGNNTYDMAVLATGSQLPRLPGQPRYWEQYRPGNDGDSEALAMKADGAEMYRVGPAAQIPFSDIERTTGISAIPANSVAMFRLNPRTSALGYTLPDAAYL